MKCSKCGDGINPNSVGWAQWVEGWEKKRRGGGTNQIMSPKRHAKYLCTMCVVHLTALGDDQQGSLI